MKKTLLTLVIMCSGLITYAQTEKADKLFNNWDYYGAAQLYQKETQNHPTADVYYELGECYRNMSKYPDALKAYDKVNSMGDFKNPVFYLHYGWMLKTSERYDDAKTAFQKYIDMEPGDPRGKMYLNSCDLVVNDHKGDLPITVKNVSSLNSPDADFSPVLYRGGVVFTSDRKNEGHGKIDEWNGDHYLELYSALGSDTSFGKATAMDDIINTRYHDGPACFSKNFDTMYFSRVDKTLKGKLKKTLGIERSKIYYATLDKSGKWSRVTAFFLNSDSFSVAHPCLSHDGSRIYFASDMKNGFGNSDIYYCTHDGAGWGPPVNAGPMINTAGTESYPALDSADNLYFSSDGFAGFGGLDICVSKLVNGQYTQAIPLKSPINSAADDFGMVFLQDGKTGYFSSNRTGGKGSDDIYYFNMGNDKDLDASIYVIGYKKPPPPPPVVVAPVKAPEVVKKAEPITPPDLRINFDVDKAVLRPDAIAKLNEIVAYLQKNTDQMVQLNGYTDISGQEEYNQILSSMRANAAAQYIESKGIAKSRIRTVGYGPHPAIFNEGVYDRVKEEVNRRVQFQWLNMDSPNSAPAPAPSAAPVFAPAGYSIQVTAVMTEMPDNSPQFKGVAGIYHIRYENGYFCYYYGFYATSAAASEGLKELSAKGVNGTIVGLSNKIK